MPRWTGPGRFTAQGKGAISRNRLADLQSRARKVLGDLNDQVRLGNIWQGYRRVRLEDGVELVAIVDATYPDNPLVQSRLLIDPVFVEEGGEEVIIPSGISAGTLALNSPKFLVDREFEYPTDAVAVYDAEGTLDSDFTFPDNLISLKDFDLTLTDAQYKVNLDSYRTGSAGGGDWESRNHRIHITHDDKKTIQRAHNPGSNFNNETNPGTTYLFKDGYAWSLLPEPLPFRGCGVYTDANDEQWLYCIVSFSENAEEIEFRAYRRRYRETPYPTNSVDDQNDTFTWTLENTFLLEQSELPISDALNVAEGTNTSTAPGFHFSSLGDRAVAIVSRGEAFFAEIEYVVGTGFSFLTPWSFSFLAEIDGNKVFGGILNGVFTASFKTDITETESEPDATPHNPCTDGARTVTSFETETRLYRMDINETSVDISLMEAIAEEAEVVNAVPSLTRPLAIDYDFFTQELVRLNADFKDAFIIFDADHDAFGRIDSERNEFCLDDDPASNTTFDEQGTWDFTNTWKAGGVVLRVNDELVEKSELDAIDRQWDFSYSMSRTRQQGDTVELNSSGSGSITGSLSETSSAVTLMLFLDLRFRIFAFTTLEADFSYSLSGSNTFFTGTSDLTGQPQDKVSFTPINMNSAGATEKEKAWLYKNGSIKLLRERTRVEPRVFPALNNVNTAPNFNVNFDPRFFRMVVDIRRWAALFDWDSSSDGNDPGVFFHTSPDTQLNAIFPLWQTFGVGSVVFEDTDDDGLGDTPILEFEQPFYDIPITAAEPLFYAPLKESLGLFGGPSSMHAQRGGKISYWVNVGFDVDAVEDDGNEWNIVSIAGRPPENYGVTFPIDATEILRSF